jgi:hypothetical protein
LTFNGSDQLNLTLNGVSAATSTAVYRDPASWYHIVYQQNGSAQTIYVNNVSVATGTTAASVFNTAIAHQLGAANTTNFFDGYMAEVNFVDGQALTPSSFGAFNVYGVWQPAKYQGTYGTNGFYLKFDSYATAAALGTDSSGNSNTWTVNNINVTAYSGSPPNNTSYDAMQDTPTLTNASVANYCVFNPLYLGDVTDPNEPTYRNVSNGNLTVNFTSTGNTSMVPGTTLMSSGKWYAEFTWNGVPSATIGIITSNYYYYFVGNNTATGSSYGYKTNGQKITNNTSSAYGASYTTGDIIGVAFDASAGTLEFYKNNTSQGVAFTGLTGLVTLFAASAGPGACSVAATFGQRPFSYTPPTGYVALNTYNLATPTIANGAAYMAATTYTGTGASLTVANTVNGVSFQPDFVWIKGRSGATDHALYDVVRGTTKDLVSNSSAAETTQATGLTAFGSTGFTVGALAKLNTNTATYVGWQWLANGTGVTNTSGSITSTVSAGATQGFSVVTYTGTGANATVGHGLGVAPSMVIIKNRVDGGRDWQVYHVSLTSAAYAIQLGSTAGQGINATQFNSTAPTSSVFSIGTALATNGSTNTFVAYCFAPVAGYSAFGSYTGNGSADGPFVYLGFKPRWLMLKKTSAVSNWSIVDTSRQNYNVEGPYLNPNLSDAETTGSTFFDMLSNGFKLRAATGVNDSAETYIYAAFAENPFKYALAR